ncbi:glycosyltransferase family 4 protein [Pantanalinema rosaneae CENA516]|uniref:glycosyltransferase family 4 protein n=1 Tax=Pantanalinema rosaneae TaxID=1620701 RepID=UPI003D6DFEEC
MKPLLVSASDLDGGAARAAYRLHHGLLLKGVQSRLLVRDKLGIDINTVKHKTLASKLAANLDAAPTHFYSRRVCSMFTPQWFPDTIAPSIQELAPDIINLHWIGLGYIQIETLAKFKQPIVWTLHDMWAFTGGCHYIYNCDHYTVSCGNCPQLQSHTDWDLSRLVWQRKKNAWKNLNLTIVTPSRWLAKCASASSLFRNTPIEVIPNGIDPVIYRPINYQIARNLLNFPLDKKLVLFGSASATSDPRKGFQFLQAALKILRQSDLQSQIVLVVFGASASSSNEDLGFQCYYLNKLNDDIALALAYASADVFIAPSVQDNLPNTIMEALACGTPCVTFDIGGMPDMIEHQKNGYLAKPFEIEDLAQGIKWILQQGSNQYQILRKNARQKVEREFTQEMQAKKYQSLFQKILKK